MRATSPAPLGFGILRRLCLGRAQPDRNVIGACRAALRLHLRDCARRRLLLRSCHGCRRRSRWCRCSIVRRAGSPCLSTRWRPSAHCCMSLAIGHDLCARIRGAFGCCVRRRIRSPAAVQRNRVRDRSRRCWCNLSVSGTNGHESPSVTILCAQAATAFAWCCIM